MMRRLSLAVVVALLAFVGNALAADKEVKCKLVKVDLDKMVLTVVTDEGKTINYDVNDDTKFLGPKGGVSDKRLKDDRLTKDAELVLVIAGNNKTIRDVRLPVRGSDKDKDK
jgi:hypothetical protein